MKVWNRTKPIDKCVIHVNVGPEIENGAAALASYLKRITGGYHHVADRTHIMRTANDNQCVAGARGGDTNDTSLHYCIIGKADQSLAQWLDEYSRGAMTLVAKQVAVDCTKYKIDTRKINPAEVYGNVRGICGHNDITLAFGVKGGHYDPGPNFPWREFIDLVNFYVYKPPVTQPLPQEELMSLTAVDDRVPKGDGRQPFVRLYPKEKGLLMYNEAHLEGETGPTPIGNWVTFGNAAGNPLGVETVPDGSKVRVLFDDGGIFHFAWK